MLETCLRPAVARALSIPSSAIHALFIPSSGTQDFRILSDERAEQLRAKVRVIGFTLTLTLTLTPTLTLAQLIIVNYP